MKVILILPHYHQQRGNKVTVERISNGLKNEGIETEVISSTDDNNLNNPLSSDIIHGFHAYQFHLYVNKMPAFRQPYMLTLTGTDLNNDLYHPDKRQAVIETLLGAKAVHVFDKIAKQTLLAEVPRLKGKVYVASQGATHFSLSQSNTNILKEKNTFVFILSAGIRKVKNIPLAISLLAKLKVNYEQIRLWIVGPIIENAEWDKVNEMIESNSEWIKYLGEYPHEEMGELYSQADVVLNTSHSEGQPSAILESMLLETPPLVANIDGNRSIVSHNETGFIFNNENEFFIYAEILLKDLNSRQQLGRAAKNFVMKHHSSKDETDQLFNIYRSILIDRSCEI